MEDLNNLLELSETYPMQLEEMSEEFLLNLRVILWGEAAVTANKKKGKDVCAASPQQLMKRAKRLSLLFEDNEAEGIEKCAKESSPKKNKRSNAELLAAADSVEVACVTVENDVPIPAPRTQLEYLDCENKENEGTFSQDERNSVGAILMPPPSSLEVSSDEILNRRPQRATKPKNLKEPQLKVKLRRPTNEVTIKVENEQRQSQMHDTNANLPKHSVLKEPNAIVKSSLSSEKYEDSIFVIPGKEPSIVSISSDINDGHEFTDPVASKQTLQGQGQEKSSDSIDSGVREVCIKIKREKISLEIQEKLQQKSSDDAIFKLPATMPLAKSEVTSVEEMALAESILSATSNATTTAPTKKTRKKKNVVHKPIKVERLSDLDLRPTPISSRTRNGSTAKSESVETKRQESIYEDAIQTPPIDNLKENGIGAAADCVVNETVNLGATNNATMNLGPIPNDATFCSNQAQTTFQVACGQTTFVMEANPNATITLNKHSGPGAPADATFDVQQETKIDKNTELAGQRSFETAKEFSMPNDDSLLTEDEHDKTTVVKPKVSNTNNNIKKPAKTSSSKKAVYKMPTRTNELFNPLAQSPVKMRVEAFENVAAAATEHTKRPLRNKKEHGTPSATTPVIGKLAAPALGRFLTPTQNSNMSSVKSAVAKKTTTSASKALPMPKSTTASSLQRSNSTASAKTLQRENSTDDFRKGLHSLAEERKKQREQKHLMAAQQREAKERERAERMAKLAKEREEKRQLKKQQEQEQKKRELEEIQRKLRQQKEEEEEAAKIKAAKEREMLKQLKQQQQVAKHEMLPPPPKKASNYVFEMLHEDDSTDDEDKVSYKRPPPPSWSRSHVRGPFMLKQEYTPAACIDSFFSVQPMTPDLKIIFPNIDARHLKRNSSVLWSTPPRYSELPKY